MINKLTSCLIAGLIRGTYGLLFSSKAANKCESYQQFRGNLFDKSKCQFVHEIKKITFSL